MRLRVVNREETGNVLTVGAEIEVIEPTLFNYLVHYRAPFTGGGNTLLPPGEKLIVTGLPRVQLMKGGSVMRLKGHSVYFEFADHERSFLYIDPAVRVLDHAKEEVRALYNGYSLYIEAEI